MSTSTTSKSSGVMTAALCVLVAAVCAASVIAVTSGLHVVWRSIFVLVAVAVGVLVVLGASSKQGSASGVVLGTLAAFASFAVFTALIQAFGGGSAPVRANSAERVEVKNKVLAEGHALLEKYGLSGDPSAVFGKSLAQIKGRKVGATTVVVPGSPTALKAAAAAPAPTAPAPAAGAAPAAPAPAAPAAPAPAAPAPAPAVPATPAPTTPPAPK